MLTASQISGGLAAESERDCQNKDDVESTFGLTGLHKFARTALIRKKWLPDQGSNLGPAD